MFKLKTYETFEPRNADRMKSPGGKKYLQKMGQEMQKFKVWAPFYFDGDEDEMESAEHMRDMFVKDFQKFINERGWTSIVELQKDEASYSADIVVTADKPFQNLTQVKFLLYENGFNDLYLFWMGHEYRLEP